MGDRLTVIIGGGGIGGLAAAVALARRGLAVTTVERAARLADAGSGVVLHPNGMAAADAISPRLGDRIRSAGQVAGPDAIRLLISASGRVLAREPIGQMGRRYGAPQVSILRTALQEALMEEAAAAGVRLDLGTAVRGYEHRDGAVWVRLTDGSTRRADLLVAADGLRSVIRQQMLGDGPPQYRGYTSVRARTTGPWVRPQGFVANGRGIQIFAAPVAARTMYWTAKITAPPGAWPDKDPAAALRTLAGKLAAWHEPIVRLIAEASPSHVTVTDIYDRDPVPRWVAGRVVLLGDAAHPMVPALGQGANMALEDAVVLADALDGREGPGAALLSYQRQRIARTARVVLLSRRQGAVDQGASRLRSLTRNAAVRLRGRKDAAGFDVLDWIAPGPAPERELERTT
jgi:2-polyprenyl-6-methoxyphenol hydroxylase-like FAD-dependent oxidoreductase